MPMGRPNGRWRAHRQSSLCHCPAGRNRAFVPPAPEGNENVIFPIQFITNIRIRQCMAEIFVYFAGFLSKISGDKVLPFLQKDGKIPKTDRAKMEFLRMTALCRPKSGKRKTAGIRTGTCLFPVGSGFRGAGKTGTAAQKTGSSPPDCCHSDGFESLFEINKRREHPPGYSRLLAEDEGFDEIKEQTPSSRSLAAVHRTAAIQMGSNPFLG